MMSGPSSHPEPIARFEMISATPPKHATLSLFSQLTMTPNVDIVPITSLQPAQPPRESPFMHTAPTFSLEREATPSQAEAPILRPLRLDEPNQQHIFDTWKHISSLYGNEASESSLNEACEALETCDVDFYLPQLCLLLIHLPSLARRLEKIVLDRCSKSIYFAARCIFCLGAMAPLPSEASAEHNLLAERVENYRYACQLAYIRGEIPTLEHDANPIDTSLENSQNDKFMSEGEKIPKNDENRAKDLRFKYLWSLKRFVRELSDIGHDLMQTQESGRSAALRSRLSQLNEQLRLSALEPDSSRYCTGLFLPLASATEEHYTCVKIPEHEAAILPSRNRVPFTFCVETLSTTKPHLLISDEKVETVLQSYGERIRCLLLAQNGSFSSPRSSSLSSPVASSAGASSSLISITPPISTNSANLEPLPHPSGSISASPDSSNIVTSISSSDGVYMSQKSTSSSSLSQKSTFSTSQSADDILNWPPAPKSVPHSSTTTPPPPHAPHLLKKLLSVPQNMNSIQTKERWSAKESRIRAHSRFGSDPTWKLRSVIVKYGLDGLQEQLSLQLLKLFSYIFDQDCDCEALLKPYDCVVVDGEASLIDPLLNAESLHQIKKHNNGISLHDYFVRKWHGPDSPEYEIARRQFMRTLVGSSLVCYILQLKDRHNGNIMIDDEGSIVHIDWGFLLWNTPGAIGFETAPFKLTLEMVAVLGGCDSPMYEEFKAGFYRALLALRRHTKQIVELVQIMFLCDHQRVPCAQGGQTAIDSLIERFALHLNDKELRAHTDTLIAQSYNNWRTTNYDYFQYYSNSILS